MVGAHLVPSLKLTAKDSENRPKPKKQRIVSQPTFFSGKLLVLESVVGIDSHNGLKVKGRIKKTPSTQITQNQPSTLWLFFGVGKIQEMVGRQPRCFRCYVAFRENRPPRGPFWNSDFKISTHQEIPNNMAICVNMVAVLRAWYLPRQIETRVH